MAKEKENENKDNINSNISNDKSFRSRIRTITNLIGQGNLTLYGTDRTSDVDALDSKFQKILSTALNDINHGDDEDISSFLAKVVSADRMDLARGRGGFNAQTLDITSDNYSTMQGFIQDAYTNRYLKYNDLHQIASQLIELKKSIELTRDAIISSNVVEGRVNRTLKFDNITAEAKEEATATVEHMEKTFDLLHDTKSFIVPRTLEHGEYFEYITPYSQLFEDLIKSKDGKGHGLYESTMGEHFTEGTIFESMSFFNESKDDPNKEWTTFIESTYDRYMNCKETGKKDFSIGGFVEEKKNSPDISLQEFSDEMKTLMNNIEVNNEPVPLPTLFEGADTLEYYKEMMESSNIATEKDHKEEDFFTKVTNGLNDGSGIHIENDTKKKKGKKGEFDDITDAYHKFMDPIHVIPIEIMDSVIGYYYVQDEDIVQITGTVSSTIYFSKFDEHRREATIIDAIAERIVKSFDKKFLEKNAKFKKLIVDCINHFNITEKRLKFQFIPAEYMQAYKIDVDEHGHGISMLEDSLFYAKLYLMLLLFKIMSIILYSNDQRVNYVRQSGIDKNIANQIQEIARIKQSRQINLTDLFSYTTLINKVGNGAELYIPFGRSGEKPIETEILSGQEIQMNNELMDMLKSSYVLATGCPQAILNYLSEADFAKTIEQQHASYIGKVVNYQLDFNKTITERYKKFMRYSTTLPDEVIENFEFVLDPPKQSTLNFKTEMLDTLERLITFLVNTIYNPEKAPNPEQLEPEIQEFKKLVISDQMPSLGMEEKIMEMVEKARINALEKKMKPNPSNGDDEDDLGLDGL